MLPAIETLASPASTIPKRVVSPGRAGAPESREANTLRVKIFGPRADKASSKFKQLIAQPFYARLHMTLILGAVFISGVVMSKLLLELGVNSILARYLTAVIVSYALFFFFVRIWLWYVSRARGLVHQSRGRGEIDLSDIGLEFGGSSVGGSSTGGDFHGTEGFGGGRDFDGGGTTDVWSDNAGSGAAASPIKGINSGASGGTVRSSSSRTSGGSSIDGDEAIVLIAFGILLVVIFGAGAYLVYQAPVILSEAAFEALLASGLVKASNKMHTTGWVGSVFNATRIPFLVLLVMTVVFGLVVSHYCPEATRLADIFGDCGDHK